MRTVLLYVLMIRRDKQGAKTGGREVVNILSLSSPSLALIKMFTLVMKTITVILYISRINGQGQLSYMMSLSNSLIKRHYSQCDIVTLQFNSVHAVESWERECLNSLPLVWCTSPSWYTWYPPVGTSTRQWLSEQSEIIPSGPVYRVYTYFYLLLNNICLKVLYTEFHVILQGVLERTDYILNLRIWQGQVILYKKASKLTHTCVPLHPYLLFADLFFQLFLYCLPLSKFLLKSHSELLTELLDSALVTRLEIFQ